MFASPAHLHLRLHSRLRSPLGGLACLFSLPLLPILQYPPATSQSPACLINLKTPGLPSLHLHDRIDHPFAATVFVSDRLPFDHDSSQTSAPPSYRTRCSQRHVTTECADGSAQYSAAPYPDQRTATHLYRHAATRAHSIIRRTSSSVSIPPYAHRTRRGSGGKHCCGFRRCSLRLETSPD